MLRKTPPKEMAAVLEQGGKKRLREPLRPVRGTTRVLVFALDGVGDEALRTAIRSGHVPRIAQLLGPEADTSGVFQNAYAIPNVLSVLPSSTAPGWTSLFTGKPPGQTGVPGNEWFVRDSMRFFAPVPTSVAGQAHTVRNYTEGLLGDEIAVPTLYELADVRSHVSFSPVFRGADVLTTPDFAEVGDMLGGVVEGVLEGKSARRQVFREMDHESVETVLDAMRDRGIPDLQVVYFPGIDLLTHVAPEPEQSMQRYFTEVLDPRIGEVLDEYEKQGALDQTYVLFVADHGHTPVLPDDRHALGADGPDEPPALLERAGFRVRPFQIETDRNDFQAVLAYHGAMAFVYLADRSTCPRVGDTCDWKQPARLGEDIMPLVRALDAANRTGEHVPELQGTFELILARPGSTAEPFQVYDGTRLVPIGEYLRRTPKPDLVELERRLRELATGPYGDRAGDILLLPKSGLQRPIEERFYFSEENHSTHGSASAQDSRIPVIIARPGKLGEDLRAVARRAVGNAPTQLDIVPLIRRLLAER